MKRWLLVPALLVAALLFFQLWRGGVSYFLAWYEDDACFRGRQATRAEIEDCLFLYVTDECAASDRARELKYTSNTCVNYKILGVDSIHVYYDEQGRSLRRVSVYE